MKRLIQWSIDHHWLIIGLSMVLFGTGLWTARQMPIDVFPDLTAPTVTILTEGHGMAPEEMESLVTFPIESAINGASGVRRVRSATAVGIAVVWVEFDWGTDIFMARQLVSEKLALVGGTLPPQVERPVLAPVSSIMGEILFFAISSEQDEPLTLRTIADTTVRRRLLAVPGVSQVTPIGGSERQFQVIAHPDALRANNDLELYDLRADPDEVTNLAYDFDANRDLIASMNAKLNALIANEIGVDDGSFLPLKDWIDWNKAEPASVNL